MNPSMAKAIKLPRIMFAAAASGSGKTLITCGILHALKKQGMNVTSFKCGPDYIDPMFHSRVIGTKSRNLDTFFTKRDITRYLMMKNAADSDLAVVEGVMGFYDGLAGISSKASAWDVADTTDTPVVFIVNCKGMSVSVIPYIKGFLEYKENSHIKGVILNQISPMLYERIKKQIEQELSVKVCGYVPVVQDCILESRHLGLVMPDEIHDLQENLDKFAEVLKKSLDFTALLLIARDAKVMEYLEQPVFPKAQKPIRIALAKDEAFCFFYQDNLQLLEAMGAELVPFSPIHDPKLPADIHGLLLYGGYPELHGAALSENVSMRMEMKEALANGLPCMAECGGFMYLHQFMEDIEGNTYPMVGTIDGSAYKTSRLNRFGYITLHGGTVFGEEIGKMPAHEFHYFDSDNCGESFRADKPLSSRGWRCIHSTPQMLAGFPHLYYYSNPKIAETFLRKCRERSDHELTRSN